MSVDTTVLILKSPDGFRVQTVGAVENITEYRDAKLVKELFGGNPVFQTLESAMEQAELEEQEHKAMMGFRSEYGIRVFEWNEPI